ncbi:hypothetical protein CBR_g12600 [Chara braunii]|uniref:N-acetylglucosaminylphosphatidylinositol deacetylase n=1 Tax=Chara braunii TaxID=69332 RepID=A0A388KS33_CHABU|nr:hypothetical protein CBR_g12600 [Chara braunii]|eukprot:GBG72880.1 hypothetical protein CBR_g12600 [Chara braunii]
MDRTATALPHKELCDNKEGDNEGYDNKECDNKECDNVMGCIRKDNDGYDSRGRAATKSEGDGENLLLVIAHPDDESMFFAPSILSLVSFDDGEEWMAMTRKRKDKNEEEEKVVEEEEGEEEVEEEEEEEVGVKAGGRKTRSKWRRRMFVLCLSSGNADGLGAIRTNELYSACETLGISREEVVVLDLPGLQDGFDKKWDEGLISKLVAMAVIRSRATSILTFDHHGISGHPNHISVHRGVVAFLANQSSLLRSEQLMARQPEQTDGGGGRGGGGGGGDYKYEGCGEERNVRSIEGKEDGWWLLGEESSGGKWYGREEDSGGKKWREKVEGGRVVVEGWELVSTGLIRKYIAWFDLAFSVLECTFSGRRADWLLFRSPSVWTGISAMAKHASQFVWYRRLFVVFSRYSYINTLRRRKLRKGERVMEVANDVVIGGSLLSANKPEVRKLRAVPIMRDNFAPFGEVAEPQEDGPPESGPMDVSLDLSRGTPRFYIMRLRDRCLKVRHITHHAMVTQCLGTMTPRAWYLAVAPPSLVEEGQEQGLHDGETCPKGVLIHRKGESWHAYRPPKVDDIQVFRIDGPKFLKLHRGTWHEGPLFDGGMMDFYNLELNDTNVNDHTKHSFLEQDGVVFEIEDDQAAT